MQNPNDIPDAGTDNDDDQQPDDGPAGMPPMPPLVIGDPFAIAVGADLMDRSEVDPGCIMVVRCKGVDDQGCGQLFKINLLDAGFKTCPRCNQAFAHLVLLAPADDNEIIRDAMVTVLEANGFGYVLQDTEQDGDQDDDPQGGPVGP